MPSLYLGVDIAGADNTWVAALALDGDHPYLAVPPWQATLLEIRELCDHEEVVAVAIDVPLSYALEHERGMRPSDLALRQRLPGPLRTWVASFNSLSAIPIRGQLLASELAPRVGTLIETHPRAGLHALLAGVERDLVDHYKGERATPGAVATLWNAWCRLFSIADDTTPRHDGELDALVCATAALAYHRWPAWLERLRSSEGGLRGWGPFCVFAIPDGEGAIRMSHVREPDRSRAPVDHREAPTPTTPRKPIQLPEATVVNDVTGLEYRDVKGRKVLCPACGQHVFESWPYGWDAHAAHTCAGLEGGDGEDRKATFKARFRRLFRS